MTEYRIVTDISDPTYYILQAKPSITGNTWGHAYHCSFDLEKLRSIKKHYEEGGDRYEVVK